MATLTTADLGFAGDNNPFADSTQSTPAEKKEAKIVRPASRIQSAASTGVAPPVDSPVPVASEPSAPVLAPLAPASAAPLPRVESPATSGDFWKGAIASAIPSVLGGLGLAGGGYLAGKGMAGAGGGGTAAPAVDEEMRQLKLAQEQTKHEALIAENYRKQEAHDALMATEAKRAEAILQRNQGKSASPTNADAQATQMLVKSEEAKVSKAVDAATRAKPVNAAPPPAVAPTAVAPAIQPTVAPPQPQMKYGQINMGAPTAIPLPYTVQQPISAPPVTTPPPEVIPTTAPAETPEKIAEKKQATQKAVLGTETAKPAKWPGGAEGSAAQLFGGTKKNFTPEAQASLEMFKDFVGGQVTMPPTGGSIHQIKEASNFYEKYTGKPLPRSPEGKLVPIPEAQIKELHEGIKTELSDAVKNGKLTGLSKGVLAAAGLLGLTGAVQAAQKGDFGPLREAGFDIGGPVAAGKLGLGLLSKAGGLGFSALTYAGNAGEANESAQVARKYAEAQKLGSPYRSVPPPR